MNKRLALIGAGGHAKQLVELIDQAGWTLSVQVGLEPAEWLSDVPWRQDGDWKGLADGAVVGMGGVDPDRLAARLMIGRSASEIGVMLVTLIHTTAEIAESATCGAGVQVLARALVRHDAQIGDLAIVNSGAIVEHDAVIGAGAHIAPGAIVLGGARVGAAAMVGAGSVVLPGTIVPEEGLVPALTRFSG